MNLERRFYYNEIAYQFDEIMNHYDLEKRLGLVFDYFFADFDLSGKILLDAGCGTGWFSLWAMQRGAQVLAMDIGESLLRQTRKKGLSLLAAGDMLSLPFQNDRFDLIICSEAIEHTSKPSLAVWELARVLKPGGKLCLTTPNKLWHFSVRLANWLKIRPYEGFENWASWKEIRNWCRQSGLIITAIRGFHLFPFTASWTYSLLNFFDRIPPLYPVMVNIGLLAYKPDNL